MRYIFYIAIFLAPTGAQFLTFTLAGYQMSPFRAFFLLSFISFFVVQIKKGVLRIPKRKTQFISIFFFFIWTIYAVITVLWARDIGNWVRNLYFILIGFLSILLCVEILDDKKKIVVAFFVLDFGIFLQGLIGWYEIITKDYRFIIGEKVENYSLFGFPIAMQGNVNDFATLMFTGLAISLLLYKATNNIAIKLLFLLFAISDIVELFISQSRANIIAVFLLVAILMLISGKRKWGIVIILIIIPFVSPTFLNYTEEILQFNFNASSGSDVVREGLIKNGFRFLLMTFGFGVGCGQIESWMATEAVGYVGGITNMHNWWMEILTGYGIGIFIGYMVFYIRMAVQFLRDRNPMSRILFSFMVGFIVAAVSSSSNISCEWLWMFWGICIAYQGLLDDKQVKELNK